MATRKITMRRVLREPPKKKPTDIASVNGVPIEDVVEAIATLDRAFSTSSEVRGMLSSIAIAFANSMREAQEQVDRQQITRQTYPFPGRRTPAGVPVAAAVTDDDLADPITREAVALGLNLEDQEEQVRNEPDPDMYPVAEVNPTSLRPSRRQFQRVRNRRRETDETGFERAYNEWLMDGHWSSLPWEQPDRMIGINARMGDVLAIDPENEGPRANNGARTVSCVTRLGAAGSRVIPIYLQERAFTHSNCIHVFKGPSCGYQGDRTTCNKRISDCFMHRNTHNFSGSRIEGYSTVP